jgi:2-keto-4-pentenoate hydratase/2-oxohepta-3-ene-1,7-dioic acid hydratase in catechol pathway
MRLASYRVQGEERLGVVVDGQVTAATDLDPTGPATMIALLAGGPRALDRLRAAAASGPPRKGRPIADLELLPPVNRPAKIVAVGRNYRDHADEQAVDMPTRPLLFTKFTTALVGDGAEIRWDPALTSQVDYEAELAVVIGRRARSVDEASALDHVFGYTCLNDVSARDIQFGDGQWVRGKSLDTFCPMGPIVVTADEIPDPQTLAIRCLVNGEMRQSSNTSQMFFPVARIVAFCSGTFTLEPGDVIATGTPGGVGTFLADGDEVVVEIDGIGRLRNVCRTEP